MIARYLNHFAKSLNAVQITWLLTLLGGLITAVIIWVHHGWINDDSVLYFEVAKSFSAGEWQAGLKLYNWPFYSLLISITHDLTKLDIQTSAQLLNILFFSITTCSFLSLIRMAGGDKFTILSGALLLFSSTYIVGDILPMLLRDQGFWAFFLAAILCFIKYLKTEKLRHAVLWQIFMLTAMLFRIEAITFLLLLPMVLFLAKRKNAWKMFLSAQSINLLSLAIILVILMLHPSMQLSDFGRIHEAVNIFHHNYIQITEVLSQKSELMGKHVLGSFLDEYSLMGVIMTLGCIIVIKAASTPGWIISILAAYTWRNPLIKIDKEAQHVMLWILALAIINSTMILLSTFVLSARYLISFAFIIMIFASFQLAYLIKSRQLQSKLKYGLVIVLLMVLVIGFINNLLPKSKASNYEKEAVTWLLHENVNHLPVFYVSPRARFFAGEPFKGRGYDYWEYTNTAIQNKSIEQYEYLLINLDKKYLDRDILLQQALGNYKLIKEFYGIKNKNKIMIFQKNHD